MNNTITNCNENTYSIDNLTKINYEWSLKSLVKSIEQLDLKIKNNPSRKTKYSIKGIYKRTITTVQGTITYKRRLYIDRTTNESIFLLDKLIGVDKYSRLTDEAIRKVFETAMDSKSYSYAGKYALNGTVLSRQTVFNCISKIELKRQAIKKKIQVPVIHIAIDGFYVSYKNSNKKIEIKFANIYTGIEKVGKKRYKLLNRFVITQTNKINFKEELLKVINENFDTSNNPKFYICGDGASWIENLTNEFPNSTFVIDKFHYLRALKRLPDSNKALQDFLNGDIDKIAEQISLCKNDNQLNDLSYVVKHFVHTKSWYNSDFICCAAENVVSHVFNHRMRAIPRTWGVNIFKLSSALAISSTSNLVLSIINISNDKLLNKFNSINDFFYSFNFDPSGSNIPIFIQPVDFTSLAVKKLVYGS